MKVAGFSLAFSLLMTGSALAQEGERFVDGQVYQQGDFFIDGLSTNCGEAQTVVAQSAPLLIQERNEGMEIVIDESRFDPLPRGVKLFVYYQTCTQMFFGDEATADDYATAIGVREGWLSLLDMQAICETDLIPADSWPGKPDAGRCEVIYRQLRNPPPKP